MCVLFRVRYYDAVILRNMNLQCGKRLNIIHPVSYNTLIICDFDLRGDFFFFLGGCSVDVGYF